MKLAHLLNSAIVDPEIEISGLAIDSRKVQPGNLFIALSGYRQHGLAHIGEAVNNGAVAVIYEDDNEINHADLEATIPALAISELSKKLGFIAAKFYDFPSKKLTVIGITGTNGKTSCSYLLAQLLQQCWIIGTLGWGVPEQLTEIANTTPDALTLQTLLAQCVEQHQQTVAMEVSSHGLQQGRVNGIDFTGAVFTNLTRDHLDFHGDMQSYFLAKLSLFTNPALKFAVLNADDAYAEMIHNKLASHVECWTFTTHDQCIEGAKTVMAQNIRYTDQGIYFMVNYQQQNLEAFVPLIGSFNLENSLAVLTVLLALGWQLPNAVNSLAGLKPVVGRMEKHGGNNKPIVFIDYAHSPDALQKALLAAKGTGRLWVVFGCGGNRDQGKRQEMGRIAESLADKIIITDDNPRFEASEQIVKDILSGCVNANISVIPNRALAIETAINHAASTDSVLIAGKGHESYQEINGEKHLFSDQNIVEQVLKLWSKTSENTA